MKQEYFMDYVQAVKCQNQHTEAGRTAELIPRLRCGNVIYCVKSEEPKVQPSDGE